MAVTQPTSKPAWTQGNLTVRTQPTGPQKTTGWLPIMKPPAQWHNYLFGIMSDWIDWFAQCTSFPVTPIVFSQSPYSVLQSDYFLPVDCTLGNVVITLPAEGTYPGLNIVVKKIDSSANTCTVQVASSGAIDGASSYILYAQYSSVRVADRTTEWSIIDKVTNKLTKTVTANTPITNSVGFLRSNSTSGNLTHTLPLLATSIGLTIIIKDVGTGGNTTSVKGNGSELIDGNNTYSSTLGQNDSLTAYNNSGTNWDVQ